MKIIKTEEQYQNALVAVELLMGQENAGDELELIAVLVEDYERRHFPIKTSPEDQKNRIYKAIIGYCEEIEHNSTTLWDGGAGFVINGHHLAQKLTELVFKELNKRSDEP